MRSLFFATLIILSCLSKSFAAITIHEPWVRPAKEGQNTAVYFTITTETEGLSLIEAKADVTLKTEIHTHIAGENGMMQMRKVEKLSCPQGHTVLKPGGNHIMLMGLKEELHDKENQVISVRLTFSNGETIITEAPVRRPSLNG